MSLLKQLWLSVFVVILIVLAGSFVLMTASTINYLQAQLYQKNIDSANNLALTLSSNTFNPVLAEVQISSQFDTGFYQSIELTAPNGGTIIGKYNESHSTKVPGWFSKLIPILPPPGLANVNNGWMQVGVLSVQSDSDFAYTELWYNSLRLLVYFILAALLSGFLGFILLRRLIKPLDAVVTQAKAISDRRFITIAEPSTLEFKQLVASMNILSKRVKAMLVQDAEQLRGRHADNAQDSMTQLLGRDATLAQIHAHLRRDDETASGCIVLTRIDDLHELNRLHRREVLDQLIRALAADLREFATQWPQTIVGRLDGGDFITLLPGVTDLSPYESTLITQLHTTIIEQSLTTDILIASSCGFNAQEDFDNILARLEQGIEKGRVNPGPHIHHVEFQDHDLPTDLPTWRTLFTNALANKSFQLNVFPVVNASDQLLHLEAPIRMQYGERQLLRAGQFLGWAKRANFITEVDLCSLSLAFEWLQKQNSDIGINISTQLLADPATQTRFITVLQEHSLLARRLWLEIPENGVYHYLDEFKQFVGELKKHACHVGIEHAGHQFEKIGLLHDVGLDYIKIDSAFVHEVHSNNANQIYLQGLVSVTHSVGLKIIAEGVASESERQCIANLGFDGMTGPAIGVVD